MPKRKEKEKEWLADSQSSGVLGSGILGDTDHLDALGLSDDKGDRLMAQGLAWKMHTEERDKRIQKWLKAMSKTAEERGDAPINPKHASLAKGSDVVAEKRKATRDRLNASTEGGTGAQDPGLQGPGLEGSTPFWEGGVSSISKEQGAKARQVEALVLLMGGSKVGEGSEFWTDYNAGSKDAAQKRAKDRGTGGTVEMSKGGGWLDGSSGKDNLPGLPWDKLVETVGFEGAKYAWDMNSIDFAEGATGAATFTAPEGDVDMTKTWGSIEQPILEARLGKDAIGENRLTPEEVEEFQRKRRG